MGIDIEETAKSNRGKDRGRKDKKRDKWIKDFEELKNEIKRKQE